MLIDHHQHHVVILLDVNQNAFIDSSIQILGRNISPLTKSSLARYSIRKSTGKILKEKDHSSSTSNIKEKKIHYFTQYDE